MTTTRRDFLRIGIGGAAAVSAAAAAPAPAEARETLTVPDGAVGLLYDATLCIGCKACQSACKDANALPLEDHIGGGLWDSPLDLSGYTYTVIKMYQHGTMAEKDREIDGFAHLKRQCLHCADPSCVSSCPVTAMVKRPGDGVVVYDPDACIGCRYCVAACPFGVPQAQYDTPFPKIAKCQLCSHRLEKGQIPACAEQCPTGATLFGPHAALSAEIARRQALVPGTVATYPRRSLDAGDTHDRPATAYTPMVYGERELGGTQVRLLSGVPFDKLGLPVGLPDRSFAAQSETLQHTLYNYLAAPAVVLTGLIAAAWRGSRDHHHDDHHDDHHHDDHHHPHHPEGGPRHG